MRWFFFVLAEQVRTGRSPAEVIDSKPSLQKPQ